MVPDPFVHITVPGVAVAIGIFKLAMTLVSVSKVRGPGCRRGRGEGHAQTGRPAQSAGRGALV